MYSSGDPKKARKGPRMNIPTARTNFYVQRYWETESYEKLKHDKHALRWVVDLESYIILNMKHNMNNIKKIKYNVINIWTILWFFFNFSDNK